MRDLVLLSLGSAVAISVAAVLIDDLIAVVLLGALLMAFGVAVTLALHSFRSGRGRRQDADQMELFHAGNGGVKTPQL